MKQRSLPALFPALGATLVATGLLAQPALAQQPAPTAPPPAATTPAQPNGWGTLPPAPAAPPGAQPDPYAQPGAYPPGAYPPGAYPPGAYGQPNTYPPGAYPPPSSTWGNGNGDPVIMGPDGRPHLLPLEIPYDADKGIPPGYKLVDKRRTSLAIAGAATFGGLWIASCVAGGFMEDSIRNSYYGSDNQAWPMYLPLIGPLIAIGTAHSSAAGTTALIFDTLGQASGVAMFIAGMAAPQKVLKFQFQGTAQLTLKPTVAPMKDGAFAGLNGTF